MAIADTGFLSSFSKIGRLRLILKALKLKSIVVPSTVYEELKNSGFFEDISRLFAFKELDLTEQSFILVRHVDLSSLSSHFSREELNFLGLPGILRKRAIPRLPAYPPSSYTAKTMAS